MQALIFWWLHNQAFYSTLQQQAIEPLQKNGQNKSWADVGCSTGLLSRLGAKLNYEVIGYDLDSLSLKIASLLSFRYSNLKYKQQDIHTLDNTFDVITATSLLSVVPHKKASLDKLLSLLKDTNANLIIIEPTSKLTRKNVWKKIHDLKSFWFYKGLLLWSKARENKAIDNNIFSDLKDVRVEQKYFLDDMVCITYIQKLSTK